MLYVWEMKFFWIFSANNGDLSEIEIQEIINNLQVLEVVAEHLNPILLSQVRVFGFNEKSFDIEKYNILNLTWLIICTKTLPCKIKYNNIPYILIKSRY